MLLYYYYTYTIIIYYTLQILSSPHLSSILFLFFFLPILFFPLPFSSSLLFFSLQSFYSHPYPNISSIPSQYSFYTCRYLHILIYIPDSSSNLTPHVLSEWMVEVCGGELCVVGFELVLTLGVILYYIIIYHTYYILYYTLLFSSFPNHSSLPHSLFPIFILYLSVLGYTYLYYLQFFFQYSRLIFKSDPARSIGVDG